MKYKTVIFDADGTLVSTDPDTPRSYETFFINACKEFKKEYEEEKIRRVLEVTLKDIKFEEFRKERVFSSYEKNRSFWLWYYAKVFSELEISSPSKKAKDYVERFDEGEFLRLFNDTLPCLEILKRNKIKMGVLSNFSPSLENIFKKLGIYNYFDFFIVSAIVGYEKPEEEVFKIAIKKAGNNVNELLYIGDNPEDDIRASEKAGLKAILIDRFNRFNDRGIWKISSLLEVLSILNL